MVPYWELHYKVLPMFCMQNWKLCEKWGPHMQAHLLQKCQTSALWGGLSMVPFFRKLCFQVRVQPLETYTREFQRNLLVHQLQGWFLPLDQNQLFSRRSVLDLDSLLLSEELSYLTWCRGGQCSCHAGISKRDRFIGWSGQLRALQNFGAQVLSIGQHP